MVEQRNLYDNLIRVAGILGIVEGLAWLSMAMVAIYYKYEKSESQQNYEPIDMDSNLTISISIVALYFSGRELDNEFDKNIILTVTPNAFRCFSFLYAIISFYWIIHSILMIRNVSVPSRNWYFDNSKSIWAGIVIISTILDLVLMSLITSDYKVVEEKFSNPIVLAAMGIMITLAARGFVLLIINVIFASYFIKDAYDRYTETVQTKHVIDAFAESPRQPYEFVNSDFYGNSNKDGFFNSGFKNDNDEDHRNSNYLMNRYQNQNDDRNSSNWTNQKQQSANNRNHYLPSNNRFPNEQSYRNDDINLHTATIGRPGHQRNSPLGSRGRGSGGGGGPIPVRRPVIPEPDYSPPSAQRMKHPELRKTNHYLY